MGIGMNNIIFVKSDKIGKMIPDELERQIKEANEKVIHVYTRKELMQSIKGDTKKQLIKFCT
jgi:hypothetical protein